MEKAGLNERLLLDDNDEVVYEREGGGDADRVEPTTSKGQGDPHGSEVQDDRTLAEILTEFKSSGDATVSSSVFNLTTTILGSGALVMPYVCATTGILFFFILLAVVAAAANYSLGLLVKSVELAKLPQAKYQLVGQAAYGQRGYNLALYSVILQQLGACILYIQIIASVIDPSDTFSATGNKVLMDRVFWQCSIVAFIIFPLSMLKNMSALQYTSFASLTFIGAFVIFVFCNGADVLSSRSGTAHPKIFEMDAELLTVVPAISFAFVCHMNAFPIYTELKDKSVEKMKTVSSVSMSTALLLYFVAGTFGYLTFLDCTSENLIEDFRVSGTSISTIFDILRGGYGIALIFAYPVVLFEMRHCVDDLFFKGVPAANPTKRQFFLNVGIIGFSLVMAILIKSVGTVFSFIGATSGSLLVFVMPSLFYLKLQPKAWTAPANRAALVMLIVGTALIPILTTAAILKVVGLKALTSDIPGTCGCSDCSCPGCPGTCTATRGINYTACIF